MFAVAVLALLVSLVAPAAPAAPSAADAAWGAAVAKAGAWSVLKAEKAALLSREERRVEKLEDPKTVANAARCGIGDRPEPQEVVMGLATGYSWGAIRTFVVSLRNTGYAGDLVLGMNAGAQISSMSHELAKYCVTAVVVKAPGAATSLPKMPMASRRFQLYSEWLETLYPKSDGSTRILIVDVRDTVFQRRPFSDFDKDSAHGRDLLLFADSHPLMKGGTADFHTYLLHGTCFPRGQTDSMVRQQERRQPHGLMLCSGSTIGTKTRVQAYLSKMQEAFLKFKCFPDGGIDQGYHNWVWLVGSLAPNRVFVPGEGPLMTMGSIADFTKDSSSVPASARTVLRRDAQGYVVNADGMVVPTLHQWDRLRSFFIEGRSNWLESKLLSPTGSDAQRIAALDRRRSEFVEWVDGCSKCPEGNQGCMMPQRLARPASTGATNSSSSSSAATPVSSSPSLLAGVGYAAGALCPGVRVAPGAGAVRLSSCTAQCPDWYK